MRKDVTIIAVIELIIASVAIISLTPSANAGIGPEIFLEPSSYQATTLNEVFNISVNIRNVTASQRMVLTQFRVLYNDTFLEVVDVNEGSFLNQFNNTDTPPYTFFTYFVEDEITDPWYGPDILIGILIWPNATGYWTNFPDGNGTLATITFKAISQIWQPLTCPLTLNDTMLVDDSAGLIPHAVVHGTYEIDELPMEITYEPTVPPVVGETITFYTTEFTYSDHDIIYSWDFGDGTTSNVAVPTAQHSYAAPGEYDVTLTCETNGFISDPVTITLLIRYYMPLEVEIDVGEIHFRGEIAEFSVLITRFGKTVDVTMIEATLYHNETAYANLTGSVNHVDTGFYSVPYNISGTAETGTYTLMVKAEHYYVEGAGIKSFQISSTLTDSIAQITDINNGIATITTDLNSIKVDLTAINATIVDAIVNSEGEISASISSALGTLSATLDTINGTIVTIRNNVATIMTDLGEVEVELDGVQSTANTTLYITSALSAIAAILAAVILVLLWKKQ